MIELNCDDLDYMKALLTQYLKNNTMKNREWHP